MSDEDVFDTQWTPAAREAYAARAEELFTALRDHVQLTLAQTGRDEDWPAYRASASELFRAAAALDDAEFDWCGNFPLLLDAEEPDDDDDDEWDDADDEDAAGDVVTLVGRWDYRVVDAPALLAAGREAHARASHGEDDDEAAAVPDAAAAAQQIAHADGWHTLDEAPGLEPIASTATVILHEDDSAPWLDGDEDPFDIAHEG
ncbi:MAG: hypothetical protein FWD85_10765 [Microbacteriaceae bacterium]|nr:hypothetical protein [Microbacteriaceae bacterium]MCL2795776.1 hypothetical protein [Microbacteriaceae bacterium]